MPRTTRSAYADRAVADDVQRALLEDAAREGACSTPSGEGEREAITDPIVESGT